MAKPARKPAVALVGASPARFVLDIGPGCITFEPCSITSHKNGRGRGGMRLENPGG